MPHQDIMRFRFVWAKILKYSYKKESVLEDDNLRIFLNCSYLKTILTWEQLEIWHWSLIRRKLGEWKNFQESRKVWMKLWKSLDSNLTYILRWYSSRIENLRPRPWFDDCKGPVVLAAWPDLPCFHLTFSALLSCSETIFWSDYHWGPALRPGPAYAPLSSICWSWTRPWVCWADPRRKPSSAACPD